VNCINFLQNSENFLTNKATTSFIKKDSVPWNLSVSVCNFHSHRIHLNVATRYFAEGIFMVGCCKLSSVVGIKQKRQVLSLFVSPCIDCQQKIQHTVLIHLSPQINIYKPYVTCHVGGCIQKFPDWSPGVRTANGTALCH
jgi:hypothetical protein